MDSLARACAYAGANTTQSLFDKKMKANAMRRDAKSSSYAFLSRFINARRRIVQPMIDQSNRAGRSPVVNVFKNRRRKNSGSGASPDPSPGVF